MNDDNGPRLELTNDTEATRGASQIQWAREVVPEPVDWVLDDRLARRVVTLVAGPRNVGKTLAAVWCATEVTRAGGHAWINSLEDDLASVLRPRCDVAGVALERMRLSAERYAFPKDLNRFAADLARHSDEGTPDDLVIFDSLQQHVPRYTSGEQSSEAIAGLKELAEEFHLGILVVAHFVKHLGQTVEQAIGGAGAVQNLSKAIYIVGPPVRTFEQRVAATMGERAPEQIIMACERLGIGPIPPSLLFEVEARRYLPTDRPEPYLVCAGTSDLSALDVLEGLRVASTVADTDEAREVQGAVWIINRLAQDGPMSSERLDDLAQEQGVFHSVTVFDRARKLAEVESIPPRRLEEVLGEEAYAALSPYERRIHWVRSRWSGAPIPASAMTQ